MALNKVKGNMYPFLNDYPEKGSNKGYTWNPLIGECKHKCSYCSTNKLKERYPLLKERYSGPLRLDEKAMKDNLGKGKFIFVCAQNDLFQSELAVSNIITILDHCKKYPDNKYLFQTKDPKTFHDILPPFLQYHLPKDFVLCFTIETDKDISDKFPETVPIDDRFYYIGRLKQMLPEIPIHITIEPIMEMNPSKFYSKLVELKPQQINVGADSGNNNLPEPRKDELKILLAYLKEIPNCEIILKDNLKRLLK